jgi:hypothetical protein
MRVLVATRRTQGAVPGDYCWTRDGELVSVLPQECCNPDRCGCGRAFAGLESHRATTTAEVVERPDLDFHTLCLTLEADCERQGVEVDDEVRRELAAIVGTLVTILEDWPVGTVVRRSGDHLTPCWERPGTGAA